MDSDNILHCFFFQDVTEQRMALQFWKFLSLHGRQTAFPGQGQLGSTVRTHPLPLNIVLTLNNSISHYMQEVILLTSSICFHLFLQ
jgi:hypothetical protein